MTEEHLTAKQWQSHVLRSRKSYMESRKRVLSEGKTTSCPVCETRALEGRSDLMREVDSDGAVLVFANIHGASCRSCGAEFLEPYEQIALEDRAGTSFRSPVSGSITLLGGKKLGTYWPKDIAAALDMHPRDALKITPLAPDTLVVRIVHDKDDARAVTAKKKGKR